MKIESYAPTRIDLAGGTIDIFPLYLFEGYGLTINAAIDLWASVDVKLQEGSRIIIHSEDLNQEVELDDLESIKFDGNLDLLKNIVRVFNIGCGMKITTRSEAPPGAGLGGSSALVMALGGALNQLREDKLSPEDLIDLCYNSEIQMLKVPGGKQDHYAAMFGGLNAIWFRVEGVKVERLQLDKSFLDELRDRLVLCYIGRSRFSAKTNWEMFKNYVDGNSQTVNCMRNIKEIALKMRSAFLNQDFEEIGSLLAKEWENRKKLGRGVTTRKIDDLITVAMKKGGVSAKVCGAGGGGCIIILTQRGSRKIVEEALAEAGARILEYNFVESGLKVTTS